MGDEGASHNASIGALDNNNLINDKETIELNEVENFLDNLKKQGISIQIAPNIPLEQRQQLVDKLQVPLADKRHDMQFSPQQQDSYMQGNSQTITKAVGKRKRFRAIDSSGNNVNASASKSSIYYNRIAALSDNDDTDMDDDKRTEILKDLNITQLSSEERRTNDQNKQNNSNNDNQTNIEKQIAKRVRFCPPIIIYNVDIREMVLQFKFKFPNIELKIINSSRHKSKLYIKDFTAYTEMMALLKEKKISSNSFTPDENKQVTVILRGLHFKSLPEDIKSELDNICPNVVANVQPFYTPYMRKNNITSSLFLITLFPGKGINDISHVKYILYQKIYWEKPKSLNGEVQCKRCQRWGHIAKNCNQEYNCMKSDQTHNPGECQLPNAADVQPFCVNCKKWGHPANFRGCEAFIDYSKTKNKNKLNIGVT